MGVSLAPDDSLTEDPNKPKPLALARPTAPAIPTPTIAAPTAPIDRVKLATDVFNTSAASTQGAYDAASRDNVHNSAAMGQVASGGLRTREGNLQLARGRDLDTMRAKLVNDATEGSVADASTAYQQALASSQEGLASELGKGNLGVSQGSLALEKEKAATSAGQTQQQIDLAKKTADINAQYQAGTLSLAQKNQALQELENTQQYGQTQQQIDLAKKQADIDAQYKAGTLTLAQRNQSLAELQNTQQFGLATSGQDLQRQVQLGQLSIAQAQQQLDEKVRTGELTVEQARQTLAELSQSQTNTVQTGQLQLAKEQLAQTGAQFGLSLAQQKDLATLADKTQNRQLDITSAYGQNTLLLELARIIGGPSGNVDPNFLAQVAKALGLGLGGGTGTGTNTTPPPSGPIGAPTAPPVDTHKPPTFPIDPNNGGDAQSLQLAPSNPFQKPMLSPGSPRDTYPSLQLG